MNNDLVVLIANVALTLSFIVALVFGVAQVRTAARDRRERFALETLRNFKTHEFAKLIFHVSSHEIPATLEEWGKLPDEDQVNFLHFSQEMESLGFLVAERFIDIDLVDKTLGSFVITSWDKLKAVIWDIRKMQPDPFLNEYY